MAFFKHTLFILAAASLSACGGGGGGSDSGASSNVNPPTSTNITISGSPVLTAKEDSSYSFNVLIRNASGNFRVDIENAPAWLRVSNITTTAATISGTPSTDADAGVFENIAIKVTDDRQNSASLSPFTLDVTAVNDAPVITFAQTELTLDARENFRLDYTLTDEEGDPVSVELAGIAQDLNASVSGSAIIGTADDVNDVKTGVLEVDLTSNGETYDHGLGVKIFPLNESGIGRTLFGRKSGPGVNLVILGDGYTEAQSDLYRADAEDFIRELHIDNGIVDHMPAWNIHVVDTPSNESGADTDFGTDTVDTFFGAGYNCADIQRLICANSRTVWTTAIQAYPEVNQVILIVNDSRFGGSGGSFSIYARNSPAIALHEMGHSFADLRDEYVDEAIADRANSFFEGRDDNVSKSTDPNVVPWSHWIEDKTNYPTRVGDAPGDTVGIFEGSLYNASGFYRPLGDSRMRSNDAFFGVVNSEAWVEQIYATAGNVSEVTPEATSLNGAANEPLEFVVQPLFNSDIQKITWRINGEVQAGSTNQSTLLLNESAGSYVVDVTVEDVTGKVRKPDAFATYSRSWTVTLN